MAGSAITRYRLIDISRGIAALAVVAVHYNGFLIQSEWGTYPYAGGYEAPLTTLLGPVYEHGSLAVPFFWMISGFVFTFVYQDSTIGFRDFSVRRLARLYPLHLATLFLVVALQAVLTVQISDTVFFIHNDAYHFVLNLFFISAWGFETGPSFNGPIWSVSVELVIYGCFWAYMRTRRIGLLASVGLFVLFVGLAKVSVLPALVTYCGSLFFAGSAIYLLLERSDPVRAAAASLAILLVAVGVLVWQPGIRVPQTVLLVGIFGPVLALIGAGDQLLGRRSELIERLTVFGDMSYSIYLLHFPLILVVTIGYVALGLDRAWLSDNSLAFLAFIAAVLGCSYASMTYVEFPARRYIQRRFIRR